MPTDVLDLSWSDRLGGGTARYDETDDQTPQVIIQAMEIARSEADSGMLIPDPPGGADNVQMMESRAYGLLLQGDPAGAVEILGRFLRHEPETPSDQESNARADEMRSLIERGHIEEASARLERWRQESLAALRIDPHRGRDY